MNGRLTQFAAGIFTGALLFGGATAIAAGISAEPAWSPIYVDGQQVQMTAYNILGSNYVRLRDIGQAVGFNVYYHNGVQVDSDAPYTGVAPAAQPAPTSKQTAIRITSYKGDTLKTGDRSGLIIASTNVASVVSSNSSVVAIENVMGSWVAVANANGTAIVTVSNNAGETGQLTLTVEGSASVRPIDTPWTKDPTVDLNANMEIRQEMIRLINQTRRENGAAELTVSEALMNAAQDCSAQCFSTHDCQYECEAALAYGYPHGFNGNLTWFTSTDVDNTAQRAVTNWVNSPGHFRSMIDPACNVLGVGITVTPNCTYCYMFAGNPSALNPYE